MTVNEVYAINIQPRSIMKVTRCSVEEVEGQRNLFLNWMNETSTKFLSQMDAWSVYVGILPAYLEQLFDDLNDMGDEEFETEMVLNRSYQQAGK
jgi:hypothetical protein